MKESVIDPNKLLGMEEDIFKQAGNNNFQSGHFNTQGHLLVNLKLARHLDMMRPDMVF